jgi:hypothetical protein
MGDASAAAQRIVVDIGSTVVKVARIDRHDRIIDQRFHPRDFEAGIARQVTSLLGGLGDCSDPARLLMCSSANGGLRIGIVCLTRRFSGAALRNQVLLAGANPVFVHDLDEPPSTQPRVDILLVGGGIDCEDAAPMRERLQRFRPERYLYGSLVYSGNRHLAPVFRELFPKSTIIANPIADALSGRSLSVFESIRRAYLDDLVYKEGVSELGTSLSARIRPTPDVVNRGFQRAVFHGSSIKAVGASLLLDIGGATTDLHYTVEIVRNDSDVRPSRGLSVARYVFTDLGIVASRESLLLQLRAHPRLYEFLAAVLPENVRETYRLLREGEYSAPPLMLSYGCLFVALDRFAEGRGPGLPAADLHKVTQILLTGGAAQALAPELVQRVFQLFTTDGGRPDVYIDRAYQLWVDGITWSGLAPEPAPAER